jgi:DNA-binding XRE family transcriptional regulator
MFDFIADLNEYFCEKYANYDKICVLPGYRMPNMHATKVGEDGRTYAYTLPPKTMRLSMQEKKDELLQALKEKMVDKTFSFSFLPLGFFARIRNKYSKKESFLFAFKRVLARYNANEEEVGECLNVSREIWENICKGNFLPTKNLIFSLALVMHMSISDVRELLYYSNKDFDFTSVKDVVICYLIEQKVFNPLMVVSALKEYRVENLFLKMEKSEETGA